MQSQSEIKPARRTYTAFSRVVVGIDSSPESLEAARQAAALAEGPISLVAAYALSSGLVGGVAPAVPAHLDDRPLHEIAAESLAQAQKEIPDAETTTEIWRGRPWEALLGTVENVEATLLAVGSHGTGRALGIVIGSTATEVIHKAPCSVLVARTAFKFPSRIVVGVDGSDESLAAYEIAQAVAARFEARLDPILASLEDDVDTEAIEKVVGRRVRSVYNYATDALVAASVDADLMVLGSRGLHGIKSLGSVSERVAHQAASSVLIVRAPS